MKVSLIFTLVVQATSSLIQQISVDSVNFLAHIRDVKKKYISLTAEGNRKVISVVNLVPSKFWSLSQGVLKVVLHFGIYVNRKGSRDFQFVTNSRFVCYNWSRTGSISHTNLIFPVTSIKMCAQYCWWIEIKKSPKYKLYDNIGDVQKQPFGIKPLTPGGNLGLCCVHITKLMTHTTITTLPFTLHNYVAVMWQTSWHTVEGN